MSSRLPCTMLVLTALAACATTHHGAGASGQNAGLSALRSVDRDARARIGREDMLTQMAFWAGEYDTFPNDLEAAQQFAEALRRGGRLDRAVQVANEAIGRFPQDQQLMLTYGMAQVALNHGQDALRPLALVAQAQPQNWRVRSALGVALDQVGRYEEARQAYREALGLRPNDPIVLSNLGMSHLLAGEPDDAETLLRQALAQPNPPLEARQNLAVAIALQGRFDEAAQIERADLPPAQAEANIEYLRSLLSDPRSWRDMHRGG